MQNRTGKYVKMGRGRLSFVALFTSPMETRSLVQRVHQVIQMLQTQEIKDGDLNGIGEIGNQEHHRVLRP